MDTAEVSKHTQEEQKKEQELIERILQAGRSSMYTWSTTGAGGFPGYQTVYETGRESKQQDNSIGTALSILSNVPKELQRQLNSVNIFEVVIVKSLIKDIVQTRVVQKPRKILFVTKYESVEEKYISGQAQPTMNELTNNGSDEPACAILYHAGADFAYHLPPNERYVNIQHRPGNQLNVKFIMPISLATQLSQAVQENPAFIRKLIDIFVKEKYSKRFNEEVWDKFGGKPPYETWGKYNSKMYFVDLLSHPENLPVSTSQVDENYILEFNS